MVEERTKGFGFLLANGLLGSAREERRGKEREIISTLLHHGARQLNTIPSGWMDGWMDGW